MLDLIEQLVKEARRVPLVVVCVARWDFLQARPNWAGGLADAATLWVEALAPEHAVRLAMEAGGLDRDDAERVAQHAGGNPFFIIEITGMLLRDDRDLPPAGPGPTGGLLPATVQAVIAARIDHLSTGARSLVRRASVFPRGRFDEDELSFLIRTPPGVARGGPRRGAADARRGAPGGLAVPQRRAPRRRLRIPREAGATAAAPEGGRGAVRRPPTPTAIRARSRSTWNRPRAPRSTSTRRTGRWRTAPSRRCRAPATPRDVGSSRARRPSSTCARWRWRAPRSRGADARRGSSRGSARRGTGWASSTRPRTTSGGRCRWPAPTTA